MMYVPLAALIGWTIPEGFVGVCIIGWIWTVIIGSSVAWNIHGSKIKKRLGAREARKLTLLEQRIKDDREGICTIVEVV